MKLQYDGYRIEKPCGIFTNLVFECLPCYLLLWIPQIRYHLHFTADERNQAVEGRTEQYNTYSKQLATLGVDSAVRSIPTALTHCRGTEPSRRGTAVSETDGAKQTSCSKKPFQNIYRKSVAILYTSTTLGFLFRALLSFFRRIYFGWSRIGDIGNKKNG